jgi:hypothetical protein
VTNAIGSGTCNLPINMLTEERAIIGRLATRHNLATGEYLRRIIRRGVALSDPEEAKKLAKLRRQRIGSTLQLALLIGWMIAGGGDAIRAPRSVRSRRNETEAIAC